MAENLAFDKVGGQFLDYYDSMRGHIRQEITRQHLIENIGELAAGSRVIDVGGGDGRDIRWLQTIGSFDVSLAEPSSTMRTAAKAKTPKLTAFAATAQQMAKKPQQANKYDLVLSHGVLMYDTEEPQQHIDALVKLAKPGTGIISLLTKGYAGTLDRLAGPSKALEREEFKETGLVTNNLGETVRAFQFYQLIGMLNLAGATAVSQAGVRVVNDYDFRPWRQVPYAERLDLLKMEHERSTDENLRHRAQMLHVIAVRGKR